ncbi:MAG TPA: dihydroorotate dehydrogenase-like protein [Candidatus Hydrogenedentes bacterium]|nr:dihydroorotate dehydrogenase-like protein [Candidatus Hydrogenedentota bacterium]
MIDLSTSYLGMTLKNPLVVSPSPLCAKVDNIKHMEDAGAAAVVLHSLFEEQLTFESQSLNENIMQGENLSPEALTYFPEMSDYRMGPDGYLELIRKAKEAVNIPIIGSLNGVSTGGWIKYAKRMQEAGADAIELNVYYIPTDFDVTAGHVREMHEKLLRDIKANVSIPVAMKISPFFSSLPWFAKQLENAGADALVMFNRFYQPDFDLDDLEVVPNLTLSTSSSLRLRLRWVAILYGRVKMDMAISGGVHTSEDVVKCMMAGANVAMTTSALLKFGISHLETLQKGLVEWMEEHEYESIEMMQGSMSQKSVAQPAAFERANYMRVLTTYSPGM